MNDICGINWISPRWGLGGSRTIYNRRTLPYANDNRTLSYSKQSQLGQSPNITNTGQRPVTRTTRTTNPLGQRPNITNTGHRPVTRTTRTTNPLGQSPNITNTGHCPLKQKQN
jgi:hypothetical protein